METFGVVLLIAGLVAFVLAFAGMALDWHEASVMRVFFGGMATLIVGAGIGLTGSSINEGKARTAFMASCQQDRKEYECTAMWRSGNRGVTAIAPVPVIIPRAR
jgi:hypothetical protein